MYRVLARKWRPQTFQDVVGQDHIVKVLINALTHNRVAHGYIFSGLRGIGKTSLTRIFSCALNCEENSLGQKTCECSQCCQIREGRHMDVLEIDGASHNSVDDIREIEEASSFSPTVGRYKIYIIDEVHMLSRSAFNALLKTLEEPPDHVKFMMATTELEKIPDTIRSRCQVLSLRPLSYESVCQQCEKILLVEKRVFPQAVLNDIARLSEGSVRDSLSLLDQALCSLDDQTEDVDDFFRVLGIVSTTRLLELIEFLVQGRLDSFFCHLDEVLSSGVTPASFLSKMIFLTRQMMIRSSVGSENDHLLQVTAEEKDSIVRISSLLTEKEWVLWLQMMIKSEEQMKFISVENVVLEMLAVKLSRFRDLVFFKEQNFSSESQQTSFLSSDGVKKKLGRDSLGVSSQKSSSRSFKASSEKNSTHSFKTSSEKELTQNKEKPSQSVQSLQLQQDEKAVESQKKVLKDSSTEDSIKLLLMKAYQKEKPLLLGCLSKSVFVIKDQTVFIQVDSKRAFDYKTLSRDENLNFMSHFLKENFNYQLKIESIDLSKDLSFQSSLSLEQPVVSLQDSEEVVRLKSQLGAQIVS